MNGQLVHFEIPTADAAKAQAFYGKPLGWAFEPYGDDYVFVPGQPSGGIPTEPEPGPIAAYFGVDDIDAAVRQVAELGGSAEEITDMPEVGRYVSCRDDQGQTFHLYQPAAADNGA